MLQELVEFEASGVIGAERYERTEDRVTERNGTRPKLLATKAGDVEVRIPKLRKGAFFPSILEPRRRTDQALYAVVMEAYVHGVSTRSVDDLVEAMGVESGISKSAVSRICEGLDESVGAFRTRALDHTCFPYVYLDATYLHVRNKPGKRGQVVSMPVVVATGTAAGHQRSALRSRGGLKRSFQGSAHQRCRVHFAGTGIQWVGQGQIVARPCSIPETQLIGEAIQSLSERLTQGLAGR